MNRGKTGGLAVNAFPHTTSIAPPPVLSGRSRLSATHCTFFSSLLLWYCLPILLLWAEIIPFAYRFHVLAFLLAGFVLYVFRQGYSRQELGFTTSGLASSLRWNLLFCVIGAFSLYVFQRVGVEVPERLYSFPASYVVYILFLGPVQELFFRGFLFAEMRRRHLDTPLTMLAVSTLSFGFLHIIYHHPPMLLITLASGLVWGILYLKWRTIWGVSVSHAVLGATAMALGLI